MITYDRNRNPITNGSQVMINGRVKPVKLLLYMPMVLLLPSCVVIRQ